VLKYATLWYRFKDWKISNISTCFLVLFHLLICSDVLMFSYRALIYELTG